MQGLRSLEGLVDDKTQIVPANGPIMGRADLQAQGKMYATILDRLTRLMRKGMGPEETLAAEPTKEFDARWGDPRSSLCWRSRACGATSRPTPESSRLRRRNPRIPRGAPRDPQPPPSLRRLEEPRAAPRSSSVRRPTRRANRRRRPAEASGGYYGTSH